MIQPTILSKYVFRIRTKNGVLVENLQIAAESLEAAEKNLKKMYVKCEIISISHTNPKLSNMPSFEDVINLIVEHQV
jgi:hypothetical protein